MSRISGIFFRLPWWWNW